MSDPICPQCWEEVCNAHGSARPYQVPAALRDVEQCCICLAPTADGIYADIEAAVKAG